MTKAASFAGKKWQWCGQARFTWICAEVWRLWSVTFSVKYSPPFVTRQRNG
ncbi:hypothetical protein KQ940_09150 [Marinobacterium sp. D7]|uniref:hypothetical protein n=1 Tax=Marinobacterium ramblicola TaxID=2849041 RepID=UPI001C2D8FD4|nr:hypothetical protein [Marinobacterium ramblicola]MBV1788220.1 hypothetical protein [Marinobacterium ramblicola]